MKAKVREPEIMDYSGCYKDATQTDSKRSYALLKSAHSVSTESVAKEGELIRDFKDKVKHESMLTTTGQHGWSIHRASRVVYNIKV